MVAPWVLQTFSPKCLRSLRRANPWVAFLRRAASQSPMSLRLEMLQVARLAPKLLGDSVDLVRDFLLRQQTDDGGFQDRSGNSDLYYSVFGMDGLIALQAVPD